MIKACIYRKDSLYFLVCYLFSLIVFLTQYHLSSLLLSIFIFVFTVIYSPHHFWVIENIKVLP
jgi:hypothetical protein